MINDTYFAPIYPFNNMFEQMESRECDFWGITRSPEVTIEGIGVCIEHIQSYFLNFKTKVFHSEHFRRFWNEYKYSLDKKYTIVNFEIGINTYLVERGHQSCAYMDVCGFWHIDTINVNPYLQYVYELIRDEKVPIIKKTCFYWKNKYLLNTYRTMEYIEKNTDYDVLLVWDHINEYRHKGMLGTYFDFEAMEKFARNHSDIYIYGCGVWGQTATDYLRKMGWGYSFLVTKKTNMNEDIGIDAM